MQRVLYWQMPNEEGFIEEGKKKAKKSLDVPLHGLWGKGVLTPLKPEVQCCPYPAASYYLQT
jgi:hypothetical protein